MGLFDEGERVDMTKDYSFIEAGACVVAKGVRSWQDKGAIIKIKRVDTDGTFLANDGHWYDFKDVLPSKLKPGMRVRIREDLKVGSYYSRFLFNSYMEQYKGAITLIKGVDDSLGYYLIEADKKAWHWPVEMFEQVYGDYANVEEDEYSFIKPGAYVV